MLSPITVSTERLETWREVVPNEPGIKWPARGSVAESFPVGHSVAIDVVNRQEDLITCATASAGRTVDLQDSIPPAVSSAPTIELGCLFVCGDIDALDRKKAWLAVTSIDQLSANISIGWRKLAEWFDLSASCAAVQTRRGWNHRTVEITTSALCVICRIAWSAISALCFAKVRESYKGFAARTPARFRWIILSLAVAASHPVSHKIHSIISHCFSMSDPLEYEP